MKGWISSIILEASPERWDAPLQPDMQIWSKVELVDEASVVALQDRILYVVQDTWLNQLFINVECAGTTIVWPEAM